VQAKERKRLEKARNTEARNQFGQGDYRGHGPVTKSASDAPDRSQRIRSHRTVVEEDDAGSCDMPVAGRMQILPNHLKSSDMGQRPVVGTHENRMYDIRTDWRNLPLAPQANDDSQGLDAADSEPAADLEEYRVNGLITTSTGEKTLELRLAFQARGE
jgi:hypothetical protein